MRKLLPVLLVLSLLPFAGAAFADVSTVLKPVTPSPVPTAEPATPAPVTREPATPVPPTEAPGGIIQPMLNTAPPETTAASAPTATPKPTGTPKPTATPKSVTTPEPTATPALEATPESREPDASVHSVLNTVPPEPTKVPAPDPFGLEVPPSSRIHVLPSATEEPPMIVNLIHNRSALENVHPKLDAQYLHIWFPIIANADEALIIYGDEVWLLDCGDKPMAERGVKMLRDLGITKIDKLFNSHPHHDHLGGLEITNKAVPIGELLICFPQDSTETMVEAMDYARQAKIPVTFYNNGQVFTMGNGNVSLKFFFADNNDLDMNNNSAFTLVQYRARRMLFTADVDRPGQQAILSRVDRADLRAEIIKYPHHGKTGLFEEFYQAVRPSLAIITNINTDWNGIGYLKMKNVPFQFTCTIDAYLHLYTDGYTWFMEQVPMKEE